MQNLPIFFVALVPFVILQLWLHRNLYRISQALTGNPKIGLTLYGLIFFPGTLVHELAHWLVATLLLVKTSGLSLKLRQEGQEVELGSVSPAQPVDPLRHSLIGLAPLVVGSGVVYALGYGAFRVAGGEALFLLGNVLGMARVVWEMAQVPQVWMWLYLIFAVANSMLPSKPDRTAWLPAALFVGFVAGLTYFAGGQAVLDGLHAAMQSFIGYLSFVLLFTLIVDVPFIVFVLFLEWLTRLIRR